MALSSWSAQDVQTVKDFLASNPTGDQIYAAAASIGLSSTDTAELLSLATGTDYNAMQSTVNNYLTETGQELTGTPVPTPAPAPAPAPAPEPAPAPLFGNLESTVENWKGGLDPNVVNVANQILSQGTSGQWQGEGAGSAEKNALYMADTLVKAGITDINQFGTWQDAQGNTVYGNEETGQTVSNTYGERQTGNAFSGTYEGAGNTAYRVQFAEDGTPIFYTTEHSSNDLANLLQDPLLGTIANVAAGIYSPWAVGALQLAQGKDLGDAAKAALLSYGAQQLPELLNTDVNAINNENYAGLGDYYADLGQSFYDPNLLNNANAAALGDAYLDLGNSFANNDVVSSPVRTGDITISDLGKLSDSYISGTNIIDDAALEIPIDEIMQVQPLYPDITGIVDDAGAEIPIDEIMNVQPLYPGDVTIFDDAGAEIPIDDITKVTALNPNINLNDLTNILKVGTVVGGLNAATQEPTQTGFDIVPVPSDWTSPTYGQPTTWQAPTPINFGSPELLRGTQWENLISKIASADGAGYSAYSPVVETIKTYADEPLTGIAAFKPTAYIPDNTSTAKTLSDVVDAITADKSVSPAESQVLNLLSNPNLANLPSNAVSAIASAVSAPRSYQDVVSSGVSSPSNISSMSPEIQKAWEIYQQSMVLGAPRTVAEAAYKAAGVDPTNPTGFFENLGFNAGAPTQEALAKYAPLALDQFAKSGSGALTYTVDPSTIPTDYVAPKVQTLANNNMNSYVSALLASDFAAANPARAQELIAARATTLGLDPSIYMTGTNGQTNTSAVG